jgi:hypothetical protein
MAISDSEYKAWLSDQSAIRCVLVEATVKVGGSEIVRYMSNRGYVTGGADSPANTVYEPIISGGVKLSESISIDASPTISFGDIEIENVTGSRDSWLNDIWENRNISVFYGDVKWARSDFRRVLKATCGGIGSSSRTTLNLLLRDDLQKLNVPVTALPNGSGSIYEGMPDPIIFGECFNITPKLVDGITNKYQVGSAGIEGVMEVRDNGVPVNATLGLVPPLNLVYDGTFTLVAPPVGTITASVQGYEALAGYTPTVFATLNYLIDLYGSDISKSVPKSASKWGSGYVGKDYPIGLYLFGTANLLATMQEVAGSIGAQIAVSRQGEVQIQQINFPPVGSPTVIDKSHIVEKTLAIDSRTTATDAVSIGYAKNWTVQKDLQTAIQQTAATNYATEWLTVVKSDNTAATDYKIFNLPTMKETLLIVRNDALAEAQRRLDVVKVVRTVYKMTCFSSMLDLELGQAVTIVHDRFGMSSGVTGVVVGLEPDWINARINVKVMV